MAMRSQTQRSLLLGFIVSLSCCGLVGILSLLAGSMNDLAERVLLTTVVTAVACILALAGAMTWEQRRWHPVGPLAIGATALALLLVLLAIWLEPITEEFYQWMVIACVAGVGLPHVALLSQARLRKQYEWVRLATVGVVTLLATQIIASILNEFIGMNLFPYDDLWYRLMGVLSIVAVCGTIAVPILHRMSAIRAAGAVRTLDTSAGIELTCPRCGKAQQLPLGRSRCGQCGLRLSIEVEEEHCRACGYSLYKLQSALCPACGTPVTESLAHDRTT